MPPVLPPFTTPISTASTLVNRGSLPGMAERAVEALASQTTSLLALDSSNALWFQPELFTHDQFSPEQYVSDLKRYVRHGVQAGSCKSLLRLL